MSDSSLPIKLSSGRRLVIEDVTDTASFSARRLSFNAKELTFLCDELAKWLSEMCEEEVGSDLSASLLSGVVLLTIIEKYLPNIHLGKWHRNAGPISFQARDNIRIFADVCVELGMRRSDVCNYSNFEKGDLKQITATLCAFAKLGIPKGLHKVSEDLQAYVDNAYSAPVKVMETVDEDEIKLSEEELAQIEREKQEALERQQRIEALTQDIEQDKDRFLEAYNRAIGILCQDLARELDFDDSSSSSSSSDDENEIDLRMSVRTSADVHEQIENAKKEMEVAKDYLSSLRDKRDNLAAEGSDISDVVVLENDLENKLDELKTMIQKEEEEERRIEEEERRKEEERLRKEEEERLKREEEERLKREEEERLKREAEEAERKRQEEERLKREEEERLKREEEERLRKEAEEAERKRQEEERIRLEKEEEQRKQEEAERIRKEEEEAERKKKEEEEQKRQEEEHLRELERQHEEEERLRREEEEAAAKKCGCRNKRPKEDEE